VLGGGTDGSKIVSLESLAAAHGNLAPAFHWVFIAAAICLAICLACLIAVEERPLHGPMRVAEKPAQ
jgi:hypothetical protein